MSSDKSLERVRLELARSKDFPNGSSEHGYDILVPLDSNGHIDAELWKTLREKCRVRRFWRGEPERVGHLVHKPGGSEHARWVFDYDERRLDDDETGVRFGAHRFVSGEYLTLRDQDGEHTFRVVSVGNI